MITVKFNEASPFADVAVTKNGNIMITANPILQHLFPEPNYEGQAGIFFIIAGLQLELLNANMAQKEILKEVLSPGDINIQPYKENE